MSDKTSIEWTDATWNPMRAENGRHICARISPGCDHCYASTMTKRFTGVEYDQVGRPLASVPLLDEEALKLPVRWKEPRRIFVGSMTDIFGEWMTDAWLQAIFMTMAACQQHTFQVLTKRPRRMAEFMERLYSCDGEHQTLSAELTPLPNVWLGTTIESNEYTWRADYLRRISAPVHFISAKPLLNDLQSLDLSGIQWVITGAESGHGARLCDLDWVRHLRDACQAGGTTFFYKQAAINGRKVPTPELDGRRWIEMPRTRAAVAA